MEVTTVKKRRSALYARVSTADQKNGLDAQVRALKIFCEQNKITDWELFSDENQSGTKASRPSLDRMMIAVENGEIESVIVFAFSRYARSVSHMLKGLETMKKHKTNFVSLTEKLDLNTSLGHVVFVIISAIAQLERDLIAERVKNGLAAARARGKIIGRTRKRNSVLIESLLEAGLSFREISRIAKCSHGSVSAQKREYVARKAKEEKERAEELEKLNVTKVFDAQDAANLSSETIAKLEAANIKLPNVQTPVPAVPDTGVIRNIEEGVES
jgi:putative DNA-invertase from lambdoid prophage Rac